MRRSETAVWDSLTTVRWTLSNSPRPGSGLRRTAADRPRPDSVSGARFQLTETCRTPSPARFRLSESEIRRARGYFRGHEHRLFAEEPQARCPECRNRRGIARPRSIPSSQIPSTKRSHPQPTDPPRSDAPLHDYWIDKHNPAFHHLHYPCDLPLRQPGHGGYCGLSRNVITGFDTPKSKHKRYMPQPFSREAVSSAKEAFQKW